MNISDKRNSKCEILGVSVYLESLRNIREIFFPKDHHYAWGLLKANFLLALMRKLRLRRV